MKRLFIILALAGTSFLSSYAADVKTAPSVLASFNSTFVHATETIWEQVGNFHKANFVLDGEHRAAFYNGDGELIAETRNLSSAKLPVALQASLKKELVGLWISELFEVSIEGVKTYYVKLEGADKTVMLKSVGTKKWTLYKAN